MPALKSAIRRLLHGFDLDVIRPARLATLEQAARTESDLGLLRALPADALYPALQALPASQSQLRQDLFVLSQCDFKRDGYFVEFGATDGKTLSNTWLLEKHFGWAGILAEPGRVWQDQLRAERSAWIETDCVWSQTGVTLEFLQTDDAELSTIAAYAGRDEHAAARRSAQHYAVTTVSLDDLLERHGAPTYIDYLSIDTEGSELEILSAFDFSRRNFGVITCEHNFTANRELIRELLNSHGYTRKFETISRFDDWYVRAD